MIAKNVQKVCCEDLSSIENYDKAIADDTQTWHCHHRREITEGQSKQQLIDEGRYYGVPASDLVFLTSHEHMTLHNKNCSEETRKNRWYNNGTNFAKNMPKIVKRQQKNTTFKVLDPDGDEFLFTSVRGVANALECTPQAIYHALNYMEVPQVHGCKIIVITEG